MPRVRFVGHKATLIWGNAPTLLGFFFPPPTTLRFTALASTRYVLLSLQRTVDARRSANTISHFPHLTVAHAHLGMYAFVTLPFFGGIYCVMPPVVEREWPYPRLIAAHFWLVVIAMLVYIVALSIGGLRHGLAMLDTARPLMDSVKAPIPWPAARSAGGAPMAAGHPVF